MPRTEPSEPRPTRSPPAWNAGESRLEVEVQPTPVSWAAWEELPKWPEGLDKPEVYWEFDDGSPVVHLTVKDVSCKFWLSGNETYNSTDHGGSWRDVLDEDDLSQATEYGAAVLRRIDEAVYSVAVSTATQKGVYGAISDFATAGPGETIGPKPVPVHGPEFDAEMTRLQGIEDEARARRQHGCMLFAIQQATHECPNIASFTLTVDKHLEVERGSALDADGNPVDEEEEEALSSFLGTWDEDDLSRYIGSEVNIKELFETW